MVHFDRPKKKSLSNPSFNDYESDEHQGMLLTMNDSLQPTVNRKKKHSIGIKEISPICDNQPKFQTSRELSTTAKQQQQVQKSNAKEEEDRKFIELERANQMKDDEVVNHIEDEKHHKHHSDESANQSDQNIGISQSKERINAGDQSNTFSDSLPQDDWSRCSSTQDSFVQGKRKETKVNFTFFCFICIKTPALLESFNPCYQNPSGVFPETFPFFH